MPNKSRHISPTMNSFSTATSTPRSRHRHRHGRRRHRGTTSRSGTPAPPPPASEQHTSARRLAAALWKMHLASEFYCSQLNSHRSQKSAINEQSGFKESGIFFKLEACAKLPSTDMEKVTKWDYPYQTFPNNISTFNKTTRAHETRRDKKKEIYQKIDSMKQKLVLERENRVKIEQKNSNLLYELKNARSSAKKYLKGYEKEKKAREEIEEVCEDLVREIEHEKADIETLKSESLRMREEVEEERRMLQMAEVWREERVQMKLVDAKIALENKYSQLNHLENEIETFLKNHNADIPAVRRAESLIKITNGESSKFYNGNVSLQSSQGSVRSINGVFKENNWGENNKSEVKNDISSEVCSSGTKNSGNIRGSTIVSKLWGGNNGNSKKPGADLQRKKRRNNNGLKGKIVGTRKDACHVVGMVSK